MFCAKSRIYSVLTSARRYFTRYENRDQQQQQESSARTAIYTAIGDLISNAAQDSLEIVAAAGQEICARMEKLFDIQVRIDPSLTGLAMDFKC